MFALTMCGGQCNIDMQMNAEMKIVVEMKTE